MRSKASMLWWIIPSIAILIQSCEKNPVDGETQEDGKLLFEIELVNFAWGFAYQGEVIEEDGLVYSYNAAKDTNAVLYHADGFYSQQELAAKYRHARTYLKPIPPDRLLWSHMLAGSVRVGDFSDTTRVGADMGALTYSVYVFRPEISKYQKIELRVDGDYSYYNRSESAQLLVDWLKQL